MARTKSINFPNSLSEFEALFDKLQRVACNQLLKTGGLVIKAGSSALAKFANTLYVVVDGVLVKKTTADCAAFAGTLPTTGKAVWVFTIDAAGVLHTRRSNLDATTLAAIVFPTIPTGEVVYGFALVENATGSDFVGGTTALDVGSLTVTYFDTVGPFLPELATL